MTKLLNIQTSKDVIFTSPWIIAEGLRPHRIVIRDLGEIATVDEIHEYVVHDEVLTENEGDSIGAMETCFMSGYYTTDIKDAIEVFADRSKRSLNRGDVAKEVTYA
jgi:catabolite regulation protein CreA